ncbi:MAG: ATP-dependent Clp protease ATP-binding subunit, partial [Clostridia bacterium]|nr:ATP-dependent Clp protease ATP-binding subunit [Clostridia bacterium]
GSDRKEGALGFAKSKSELSKEKAMKGLKDFLRPEFIGRVDEIVVFNDLTDENYEKIAVLMMDELKEPLLDKGITFTWEADVPNTLVKLMGENSRGARDLRNVIRRRIEDTIATVIVDNVGNPLSKITIVNDENDVRVIAE